MSIVNTLSLESNRQIKINFDGGDLSSDAGLLLIKEFVSKLGISNQPTQSRKISWNFFIGDARNHQPSSVPSMYLKNGMISVYANLNLGHMAH